MDTLVKNALKHIFFILSTIVLNFLIQTFLKQYNVQLGIFKLSLIFNAGFIFGLYNEASFIVRIVVTSVMVGMLTIVACYFYEFLHPSLNKLRWGITFTLAGVVGNGLEKLIYGYVWDFITIDLPLLSSFTFNINDLLQMIGLTILVIEIFRKQDVIWFPNVLNKRKITVIYRDIQLPILFKVMGLIFIGSLTQAILTVALLFPYLKRGSQDVQLLFFLSLLLVNLALLPLLGKYLLKELLRCLGPVFALERYLHNEAQQEKDLKFRKTDHFQNLETDFNHFVKKLKNKGDL
jgi:signal peptidase II